MGHYKTVCLFIGLVIISISFLGVQGFIIEINDEKTKKRKKVLRSLKSEVALFLFIIGLTLCFIPQSTVLNQEFIQREEETYTYPGIRESKNRGNVGIDLFMINPDLTPAEKARAEGSSVDV